MSGMNTGSDVTDSWMAGLATIFRRDGLSAVGKVVRYGFSPKAWRWFRKNLEYRRIVKKSGLVDEEWYRREYPEVAERGLDPVQDFLTPPHDRQRLPNPDFVPSEYAAANFDVKVCGLPWAVHYAKDGMREGRPTSLLDNLEKPFPDGTVELRRVFPPVPLRHRRTAVFASFSGDGRIKDTVLYYLRGLREVVDNIVFIANNPVVPEEVAKLDGLVRLAVFRHHGCYDFGSYKIGWSEAKELGLLEPDICDEVVICNDSCYGPVFPFSESFGEMARLYREAKPEDKFDFWGMTAHELFGRPHVQSYFYVFGKGVLESRDLDRFFTKIDDYHDRGQVVFFCETMLSTHLFAHGHRFESVVPGEFSKERNSPPIKFPVTLFSEFRMPLFKAKTLKGESKESLVDAVEIVRRVNPELAAMLPVPPEATAFEKECTASGSVERIARERHVASLSGNAAAIRTAQTAGRPIRLLFLSLRVDTIPWAAAAEAALRDPSFLVRVAAVPDLRIESVPDRFRTLREVRADLLAKFRAETVLRSESDSTGAWNDLAADADVVAYPTAEDASDFRYNPHWSVGRPFLPVLFFDHRAAGPYPLEKEFARQNYAYFWKVFFHDREAFNLYAKHSLRKGENAVFVDNDNAAAAVAGTFKKCLLK